MPDEMNPDFPDADVPPAEEPGLLDQMQDFVDDAFGGGAPPPPGAVGGDLGMPPPPAGGGGDAGGDLGIAPPQPGVGGVDQGLPPELPQEGEVGLPGPVDLPVEAQPPGEPVEAAPMPPVEGDHAAPPPQGGDGPGAEPERPPGDPGTGNSVTHSQGITLPVDDGSAPGGGDTGLGTPGTGSPDTGLGRPDANTPGVGSPDVGSPDTGLGTPDTGSVGVGSGGPDTGGIGTGGQPPVQLPDSALEALHGAGGFEAQTAALSSALGATSAPAPGFTLGAPPAGQATLLLPDGGDLPPLQVTGVEDGMLSAVPLGDLSGPPMDFPLGDVQAAHAESGQSPVSLSGFATGAVLGGLTGLTAVAVSARRLRRS